MGGGGSSLQGGASVRVSRRLMRGGSHGNCDPPVSHGSLAYSMDMWKYRAAMRLATGRPIRRFLIRRPPPDSGRLEFRYVELYCPLAVWGMAQS